MTRRHAQASGFTLLEILVVVVIVGIVVSVVALSSDLVDFDRKMEQESRRLESLLELAAEDALLQSQDYGLRFFAGGYEFFAFDHASQSWRPLEGDRVFEARELDQMVLELKVDGREVVLDAERGMAPPSDAADDDAGSDAGDPNAGEEDDEDEPLFPDPQVVIFSSGEYTPFELTILNEAEPFEPGIVLDVEFDGVARDETLDEP